MKFSAPPKIATQPSLPEQVAEFLAAEIEKGTFRPGETLPSEAELAAQLAVSRTVIREALARLKYDGLLESRRRVGATVAGPQAKRAFRLRPPSQDIEKDLGYLYELRAILEGDAAALAAQRRTDHALQQLRSCLLRMAQDVEQGALGTEADIQFHRIMAEAAGNPYLRDFNRFLTDKLWVLIERAREKSARSPELAAAVQREHVAIFDAIVARDAAAARQAALNHIRAGARRQGLSILDFKKA